VEPVPALDEILEEARTLGLLGPEPVERHIRHGRILADRIDPPGSFLDLGSGAGVPGLVLALAWPAARATLLEASGRRSEFCARAIERLGLSGRVTVARARAEEAGREVALREQFDAVVARSFARPAVTAECAAPFLRVGGHLLVSEPPDAGTSQGRWPEGPLADLGLGPVCVLTGDQVSSAVTEKLLPTSDRFARRTGIPAKRPLWE
jgi:16S rRNA (guanine527-N7)-methyltransferase